MPITTHDIRQALLENDQEFRRLAEEHSRCECQLQDLVKQSYWNVEDLALEVSLKKMKLLLKDQMELIVARHRQNQTVVQVQLRQREVHYKDQSAARWWLSGQPYSHFCRTIPVHSKFIGPFRFRKQGFPSR